ncbi:hypothetical protein CY34DRAFT_101126, partial [Suillus luteus UH-Slu-Lm8-n1]
MHTAADGLSRRPAALEDDEDETTEDVEEWIDEILGCGVWIAKEVDEEWLAEAAPHALVLTSETCSPSDEIPTSHSSLHLDNDLHMIQDYFKMLSFPSSTSSKDQTRLIKRARQFFLQGHRLWRKEPSGRHQLVIPTPDRLRILSETHDKLGHKGFY